MGKKNGGKRISKSAVADALQGLFTASPNETFSLKEIFRRLKLATHPAKMLAIDALDEMCWDDYLSKLGERQSRMNTKGPTGAARRSSCRSATRCSPSTATACALP